MNITITTPTTVTATDTLSSADLEDLTEALHAAFDIINTSFDPINTLTHNLTRHNHHHLCYSYSYCSCYC